MTMLQHYYTSCEKGRTGSAGFQCKAMSEGISPDELKAINNMIGYRIPPTMDEYDIAHHPIGLRYNYLGPQRAILVCSQSNGTDEKGRPGNFFAHSVLTDPQDFAVFSPIMFWRHDFWRTSDPSDSLEIPPEDAFKWEPSLEFDEIWSFLEEGKRREWFYKLLCATIHYNNSLRSIIILDEIDHVAHWIAAITFALPALHRPFLTFATYHHDPYQTPFRITGTTADSKFRFSSDEYISYFILNAKDNRISEVEESVYAEFVSQNFEPKLYEDKLLTFFNWCKQRIPREHPPHKGNLAGHLEPATYGYLTIQERQLSLDDPNARRYITALLDEAEEASHLSQEQIDDLNALTDLMADALSRTPSSQLMREYGRLLLLLRKHNLPFGHRIESDLSLIAQFILERDEELTTRWLLVCQKLYPNDALTQIASQPDFIAKLTDGLSEADWQLHYLLWKHLGPLFRPDKENLPQLRSLIQRALDAVEKVPTSTPAIPPPEAEKVLEAIVQATANLPSFWLDGGLAWKEQSSGKSFYWLYYLIVKDLPLSERKPYRKDARAIAPKIDTYEIQRDIQATPAEHLIPQLEAWANHSKDDPTNQRYLFSAALQVAWSKVQKHVKSPSYQGPPPLGSESNRFAGQILASPLLSSLLDRREKKVLLSHFFSALRKLEPQTEQLYQKYIDSSALTPHQRALIGGSLAMTKGILDQKDATALQQWLSKADQATYKKEANQLMARFFAIDVTLDSHIKMIQATYVSDQQAIFWELYWEHFRHLLLDDTQTSNLIKILSYWFDQSLSELVKQPYVAQTFFLQLPSVLEEAKSDKEFSRMTVEIQREADKQPWYPLISQYMIPEKKKGIFGLSLFGRSWGKGGTREGEGMSRGTREGRRI